MRVLRNTTSYVSINPQFPDWRIRNQSERCVVRPKSEPSDFDVQARLLIFSATGSRMWNLVPSSCEAVSASLAYRWNSATYILILHVDDNSPPAQAADAKASHTVGTTHHLSRFRHACALDCCWHQRLDMVCKERLGGCIKTRAATSTMHSLYRRVPGRFQSLQELHTGSPT
jgi:hypothetical protein